MADRLRSGGSTPQKPDPPPKPKSASSEVTSKIDNFTAKLTHLEEKTSLLYVDMEKKNNQLSEEMSHLRSHITTLQRDHTSLQHSHARLQKEHQVLHQRLAELNLYLEAFQTDFSKALSDQRSLKEEQEKLKTELLIEPGQFTLQTDFNKVLSDQRSLKEEQEKLKTKLHSMEPNQHTLQSDLNTVLSDQRSLKEEQEKLKTKLHSMEPNQHTMQSSLETLPIQQADVGEVQPSTDNVASPSHHHAGVEDVTVTQLVSLVGHLQSHLSQLQTEHSQWEAHFARLQTAQAELATSHSNMQGEMETSCSAMKELKTKLRKTRTLFYACQLNKDQTDYFKAMVFNSVTNNKDGHYNAQTGVFTTPYAGLYIFTVTLASSSPLLNPIVYGHIMVDDTVVSSVTGGVGGGSACVPMSLEPGQQVWLKPRKAIKNFESSEVQSSFSGTLVLLLP